MEGHRLPSDQPQASPASAHSPQSQHSSVHVNTCTCTYTYIYVYTRTYSLFFMYIVPVDETSSTELEIIMLICLIGVCCTNPNPGSWLLSSLYTLRFGGPAAGGSRVAAGYATQYGGSSHDLAFVTVKGAGHEVPMYKPAAAFTLFSSFLNGTAL